MQSRFRDKEHFTRLAGGLARECDLANARIPGKFQICQEVATLSNRPSGVQCDPEKLAVALWWGAGGKPAQAERLDTIDRLHAAWANERLL